MKVTRTGPPTASEGAGETGDVGRAGGKSFDPKLGEAGAASGAGPQSRAEGNASQSRYAELGSQLESGAISAEAAVEKVMGDVLAKHVPADAPAGMREQVMTAMDTALKEDAVLMEKFKSLKA